MLCSEHNCAEQPMDEVRIALTTPTGSMTVEVWLCSLHISTLELQNRGSYLFIRPTRES